MRRKGIAVTNLSASDLVGVVLWFAVFGFSAAIIADVFVR